MDATQDTTSKHAARAENASLVIVTLRPTGEPGMTYHLTKTGQAPAGAGVPWSKFVSVGDRVSDKRLGTDQNVGYTWSGSLPLDELKTMSHSDSPSSISGWAWVGFALFGLGAVGVWRTRNERKNKEGNRVRQQSGRRWRPDLYVAGKTWPCNPPDRR